MFDTMTTEEARGWFHGKSSDFAALDLVKSDGAPVSTEGIERACNVALEEGFVLVTSSYLGNRLTLIFQRRP